MTTKSFETIRKALEQKYDFPYYALIRVHSKRDGTFHIPAPLFNGMSKRAVWAGNLQIASDKRDGEYFECPFCGESSFYVGVCQECKRDYEIWDSDFGNEGQWVDGPLPNEYRNHEAMKKAAKDELLRRIDTGVPLGIISAEIVLPVAWGAEWDPSPFLKRSVPAAQWALDRIEKAHSIEGRKPRALARGGIP